MEIVGMGEEQHKEKYKRGVGDCQCQISRPDPGWCVVLRGYVLCILFACMHQHSELNSNVWLVCWVYLILLKSIEKAPDSKFWIIKCRIFIYSQWMPIIRIKLNGKLHFTHLWFGPFTLYLPVVSSYSHSPPKTFTRSSNQPSLDQMMVSSSHRNSHLISSPHWNSHAISSPNPDRNQENLGVSLLYEPIDGGFSSLSFLLPRFLSFLFWLSLFWKLGFFF